MIRGDWFAFKIPRGDTNGVGEYEVTTVTVTSEQTRKNTSRENTETEKRRESYILGRLGQRPSTE